MMELERMESLARLMNDWGLTGIEVWEGEHRVRLERGGPAVAPAMAPAPAHPAPAALHQPAGEPAPQAAQPQAQPAAAGKAVTSPMVGVFYAAPAPDQPPFVSVGDRVKKGQVLCIIEAMKLMNEITAEQDGTLREICAQNGELVEYGQPLFIVE